jgi:U4/U6.U5 tri-snRNP component SNU23
VTIVLEVHVVYSFEQLYNQLQLIYCKMSNNNAPSAESGVKVGMFGRRQWDEQVYQARANERLAREETGQVEERKRKVVPAKERQPLRAREESVELDSVVGRRGNVTAETPNRNAVRQGGMKGIVDPNGGLYCKTCDCVIKDSISYLDHMNSKGHLYASGMTTRAVKATVEDVMRTLSQPPAHKMKKKPSLKKREEDLLEERILKEQTEKLKQKETKDDSAEDEEQVTISNIPLEEEEEKPVVQAPKTTTKSADDDLMAKLGFAGFASKKK